MILSGALVLSWLPGLLPPPRQRVGRVVSWLALGLAFAAFYLTVLFPFFPLRLGFPFINCRTPGMYMVHQKAYLEMALLDRQAALFGLGRTAVVERYPDLVDRGLAVTVLAEYHMDELLPSFIAYMDAHCEYLNLATAFGLPALAALAAFLAMLARRAGASSLEPGRLLLFFVAGLCMACLWDDLLSKRWIWLTLGLLAAASETAAACPAGAVSPVPTPGARAEPATP